MTETKTGNDIDRKKTIGEWKLLWIGLIVICLCIVLGATSQSKSFHAKSKSRKAPSPPSSPAPTGATEAGPVWGTLFNGAVSSNQFPKLGCEFNDKKICCSAMESVAKKNKKPKNPLHHHCSLVKKYFPSPYEKRHLEVAEELAKIPELHNRTIKFIEFIESSEEIDHSKRWLDRVATRQQGIPLTENDIDREYLSRFRVTRKCSNNAANHSWWEYIEPLSVHARHPFGLGECWHPHFHEEARVYNGTAAPNASLLAVDYLLLQTPSDLTGHASATSVEQQGRHSPRSSSFPHEVFLFDAGTSRFDSSLFWFICAYQQLGFLFDHIFGWEFTLLEPIDFWNHVPTRYLGLYRFFNAPISANTSSPHSPTRLIKQLTSPEDFVIFKLDVDTTEVEIPIALEIRNNPELHPLIDEFFFELHFRCEILMDCSWGYTVAEEANGLKLDRPSALKLFRDIRRKGIRAHIWP